MDAKWSLFQDKIFDLVDGLDENQVPLKQYALSYAHHILANLEEGAFYGQTAEEATRTQLLYVISNLGGAHASVFESIKNLASAHGIDVSEIILEVLDEAC